jgi:hypothetical protein
MHWHALGGATMKVINFKINAVTGSVHVVVPEQVILMLRQQGLLKDDDLLEVDWSGTGKFSRTFTKKQHAVCPYCGTANSLKVEDMGSEEFECCYCEGTFTIPETTAELPQFNLDNLKASTSCPPPSHYRVMFRGEDGIESCLKNGVPAEYASLVCEGFQSHYSEGQVCWLEAEETIADLHRMCMDYTNDRY